MAVYVRALVMRLSKVVIRRFKSINELEIRIPERDERRHGSADFVSIVGENNVGKSTILEAIRLACPGGPKTSKDHFPNLDFGKGPIEVELEFNRLTDQDKEAHAIRAHVYTEDGESKYRIKKVWKEPGSPECYAYTPDGKSYRFRDGVAGTVGELEKTEAGNRIVEKAGELLAQRGAKKGAKKTKELLLEAASSIGSPLIEEEERSPWVANPGGNTSNVDTLLPKVIYVPALRETKVEADVGQKQSAIRKIVEALFEQQLANHEKVVAYRAAAKDLGDLFDVEGKHPIVTHVESKITGKIRELIDIQADLRFEPPDVTSDLAGQTELRIQHDGVPTKPEHQGHGAQRSIVLSLLQLYAEQLKEQREAGRTTTLLLIEEPEIYMHPEMCRRMRDALLKIAQSGVAQVVCTTHSPVFLDLADRHDGIVIVKRRDGVPFVKQRMEDVFDQSADDDERRARLRMILNFDPAVNEVFFSKTVCLVEGDCEVAAIDAIACKLRALEKIDWSAYLAARRAVAVVSCRGKWTIPAFQKVLKAFDIRYRVVHDEDPGKGEGPRRANDVIKGLLTDEDRLKVHSPDFEGEVLDAEWTSDKPWKATTKIGNAEEVNDKLIAFFEFVLGRTLDQLRAVDEHSLSVEPAAPPVSRIPKRNLRALMRVLDVPPEVIRKAQTVGRYFRIAAGPPVAVAEHEGAQLLRVQGANFDAVVRVTGHSMSDTLLDGDHVAVKKLDNVQLHPVSDNADKQTLAYFREHVEHNGIYALAINDEIEQRAYTVKRVWLKEWSDGGWVCQIHADNPDAGWGERGLKEIRKTDRVHFAAKVIGIVRSNEASDDAEPSAIGEREIIPIPET